MSQRLQLITAATCLCLFASVAPQNLEKWSRQLEETEPGQADSFDWVPLAQPVDGSAAPTKDRSANGRVLTYSQTFPPNARFGNLPKAAHNTPSAQPQSFDFPYQFQRFVNTPHAQPLRQHTLKSSGSLQSQEPTSQSFFKFEMPFHGDSNRPASAPSSLQTGYQIQHSFGGGAQAALFNSALFNQNPVFPPEFHPIPQKPQQQALQPKPLHQQNFIEDTFPVKNSFRDSKPLQQTQESLQTVTPQVFPVDPQPESIFELNKPSSFQAQSPYHQSAPSDAPAAPVPSAPALNGGAGPEEVQLLYVPYDTLYNQQRPQGPPPTQNPSFEINKFNFNPGLPAVNPYQINQFYTQDPLAQQDPNYYTTSTTNRPLTTTTNKLAPIFQNYASQQFSTPKPKPKAHQPPLAMFLIRNSARPTQSDVVATLRNANTISVLDAPTKAIPEIFVGPAGMPIPNGYVKFDLPYLSQLSQTRELRDVPFFVAPLSYRTPNGFNKILLPEPHVGSIVINRAKDTSEQVLPQQSQQQPQKNSVYITPESNDFNQYPTSTQRTRPSTQHRYKQQQQQPTSPNEYYPDVLREQTHKNRQHYEATTQRTTSQQPSRGNKFSYFYDQDVIQEVTSPKISKHERPKKKRPQNVQIEQPSFTQNNKNSYAQFQPIPNQIAGGDDYYKLQSTRPATTSTSTTSTSTTTTSSTTPAPTFYSFNTSPQVEFQSTNGQLYHDFTTAPKAPEEYVPRFTTRPPPVTAAEEEYQMKQYFRQQNALRNRPQAVATTNSPFEQIQYTPVSLDYDRPANSPVTTQKPTTHKQRVTFYTPTPAPTTPSEEQPINTIPPRSQAVEYTPEEASSTESSTEKIIPNNHRPSYNQNEILDGTVEYDPNPYQLPSELPPLTANLPGLVNGLQEKEKQNALDQTSAATPAYEEPPRPTRRPINRVRKPVVAKVSSSVSYSESETTSKRPTHRIRRPYGQRGSSAATDSYNGDDESSSTTTRRPAVSRNPLIRNPNRIRYQPTPEERQTLRIKPKKKYSGSNKVTASEDLDYQRDVLKQNYPVFRPSSSSSSSSSSRRPTSPTAIPSSYSSAIATTDRPTSESQQVYTVTPSNTIDNTYQVFPAGLLEPMQIAQQYNDYSKDNYGPGYFPNQEDLNPTEPILRNEINPVYTTLPTAAPTTTRTTTTTEEPVATTTRRSPFIRRNYPRLRSTTTDSPTTTTTAPEERQSVRPRIPPRKVIKVRTRTRRPQHPASSTTAPEEEQEQEVKANYRKLSRFNQDLYENDTPRRRYKQQFHLDGQESQWSPAVKTANRNSFNPIDLKDERQENKHNFANEPEIVTAGPEESANNADTYEVNVSANLRSPSAETKINIKQPNLKPEKSFAELLEEVMGKAPEEYTTESDLSTRTTDGTFFESQKTSISNRLNRRGKWKKLKGTSAGANNGESFETAESQNIGAQLFNSLRKAEDKEKPNIASELDLPATTPLNAISIANVKELTTIFPMTTTPTPLTTMDEFDMTTARVFESTTMPTTQPMDEMLDNLKTTTMISLPETTAEEESATSRLGEDDLAVEDDLETQPSLFSEVKRQLHELFAIEENDDDAASAALAAVGRRRQEYTNIKRPKPVSTTTEAPQNVDTATEPADESGIKKPFHKNLMEHVVYATATSTKVSSETEICYRGRCIRSEDLPPNHKLN